MSTQVAANTLDYYAPRTDPDGPAMTDAIHAVDAAQIGEPGCATHTYLMRSIRPFVRDPFAQFTEARGDKAGAQDPLAGSPAYNFLTGSGGFSQVFTFGLTGLRWREDRIHLDPMLPPQLADGVTLKGLHWRGRTFDIEIGATTTTVTLRGGSAFTLESPGGTQTVSAVRDDPHAPARPGADRQPRPLPARHARAPRKPGQYAEAAVDGSAATVWSPTASPASLTVDLGTVTRISSVVTTWGDAKPAEQPHPDLHGWHERGRSAMSARRAGCSRRSSARYVRVEVTSSGTTHPSLRELAVG